MGCGPITFGIVTASDKGARGEREDQSGKVIQEIMESIGGVLKAYKIVPDELEVLKDVLTGLCDQERPDLILTTGGTGWAPRDVTPEATKAICEREVPGLGEAMRAQNLKFTPLAVLSRATAGIRGRTLIVNLPGSSKAARECLQVIIDVLPHGIETLRGEAVDCAR